MFKIKNIIKVIKYTFLFSIINNQLINILDYS